MADTGPISSITSGGEDIETAPVKQRIPAGVLDLMDNRIAQSDTAYA
jgi:hypothetical protein